MKLPVQYALFYPDRRPMPGKRLDLFELGSMSFEKPDLETFRGLKLAYQAAEAGGTMPTVYNAANERALPRGQLLPCPAAKRAAGGRQQNLFDSFCGLSVQGLKNSAVFAVHRQYGHALLPGQ